MDVRAHLAEVLRWSAQSELELVEALAAGLGMAIPLLVAAATGQVALGLAAAFGSLLASGVGAGASAKAQVRELAATLFVAALAAVAAALAAGRGWLTDAILVALAMLTAVFGGFSRPLAIASIRFVLFLIIVVNAADAMPQRGGFLLLVAAGALWTALLTLLLGAAWRRSGRVGAASAQVTSSTATTAQKLARWRRSLRQLGGWQYTLRLGICLGIAGVLRSLWPEHHFYWIALTVALLTQRQVEALPVRTTQRALGTALGVLIAGLFLVFQPPLWGLVACIGLLAGARPLLRSRNYLAYSAAMAPLVMLLLDGSGPLHPGLLLDRLVATLIGVALVLAANRVFCNFAAATA